MPRGFTSISFVGGKLDGETIDEYSIMHLGNTFNVDSEAFYAERPDGSVAIYKGKLNSVWTSFSRDVYLKEPKDDDSTGVVFKFKETLMVHRCSTITKKGTRCMKLAMKGKPHCTVHKPKSN